MDTMTDNMMDQMTGCAIIFHHVILYFTDFSTVHRSGGQDGEQIDQITTNLGYPLINNPNTIVQPMHITYHQHSFYDPDAKENTEGYLHK